MTTPDVFRETLGLETEQIHAYWRRKHATSLDGSPTGNFADEG